jgi:hypothetical protein
MYPSIWVGLAIFILGPALVFALLFVGMMISENARRSP